MADEPLVVETGVHKPDACVIWLHLVLLLTFRSSIDLALMCQLLSLLKMDFGCITY